MAVPSDTSRLLQAVSAPGTDEKTDLEAPSWPGITCVSDFSNFFFPPGPSTADSVSQTGTPVSFTLLIPSLQIAGCFAPVLK